MRAQRLKGEQVGEVEAAVSTGRLELRAREGVGHNDPLPWTLDAVTLTGPNVLPSMLAGCAEPWNMKRRRPPRQEQRRSRSGGSPAPAATSGQRDSGRLGIDQRSVRESGVHAGHRL